MVGTEADHLIPGDSSAEVPALVQRYVRRVLALGARVPSCVRVTQAGEMWLKPGGRALRFEAVEVFAVDEVAFSWRARFPIAPLVSLRVLDRYAAGEGQLEARLFGLPLTRARGQATAEGEAMRYLAELPWVPQAMAVNRQLEWRELDRQTVEVAVRVGPARVAVRLEFNAEDDIVGASTDARPRPEGKTIVPRPWGGVFADYAVVGGIRVPRQAEVRWDLPEGSFTYWRGAVTSLELE
jgi:hypothetical protein